MKRICVLILQFSITVIVTAIAVTAAALTNSSAAAASTTLYGKKPYEVLETNVQFCFCVYNTNEF